ncbi:squamosa promoter-binding-like protein 7 [Bidens hawaiensis]|uniref:squamosa promoter-binding-like protein 7 n=1 Tax=Bidens hawaiensis TaxID=980011 RepID=UPI004049F3C0
MDDEESIWDWSQFVDFNIDDHIIIPSFQDQHDPLPTPNPEPRVRKRDPRTVCPNFLAGRIPCACPELEEEESGKKNKKKKLATSRCQVPDCQTDISELKGYHKRHRVCLRCAYAPTVLLDGHAKRYCQQCGKFHMLSDFDEGKRSCRRKLERHNNRRRRKSTDSKAPELHLTADYDDETGKGGKSTSSETAAGEKSSLAGGGHNSNSIIAQNIQSDSIPSGETQTDEDKEKTTHSPSYGDDKTDFSSMCTTGRISFKLYDWNPADFPRRLRHQIFQWLSSMPVELEGYIRPGCTILTIFIAMPRFMWLKINEDPIVCILDLLASPRCLLSGRDTFFVSLNESIYGVMKGGRSVIKIEAVDKSPRLRYVQPTCFEAGKPIEFVACGSNLLQPRLRFLVSFAGKYMTNDARVSPLCNTSTTNLDNQLLNISVSHSELNVFGPGFIEVENESGLSNFIPILIADKEICSEIKIMQTKYYSTFHDSQSVSCEDSVNKFSEVLVDIAWLLKRPVVEDVECAADMSSQLQRFKFLLNFLIEYESTIVLKRVLDSVKMRVIKNDDMVEMDRMLQGTVNHANEVLNQRSEKSVNIGLESRDVLVNDDDEISTADQVPEQIGLLNADYIMSVTPYKEQPKKPSSRIFNYKSNKLFTLRPLILAVALVTVCFGICAVVFHPHKAAKIAITIHRCLFDDN